MGTCSWSVDSKEPGQTAWMALYWWQRLITFGVDRIRVKNTAQIRPKTKFVCPLPTGPKNLSDSKI